MKTDANPTSVTCPICRSPDYKTMYDFSRVPNSLCVPGHVARCLSCSMWFKIVTHPDVIAKAYTGEYGNGEDAEAYLFGDATQKFFHKVLRDIKNPTPMNPRKLLDIGSGGGALLHGAKLLGFDAEGVDLCEANVLKARERGLRVTCADAEKLSYDQCFDAVTMMDIIEHVPDPVQLLEVAYRALKPGGELVVYTPNHRGAIVVLAKALRALGMNSPMQEIFGGNHVCFFDDRTLKQALLKARFEIRKVHLSPYDPRRPGTTISPVNLAAITAVEWLGIPLKRVFRLLITAQKPLA